MSEYELSNLFFQALGVANATMANYMTLVFGMLVSSYLAAHRLDRIMMWIALLLYSLFALGFCNEIFQIYTDFSRLGLLLAERAEVPTADLGWLGPVTSKEGGFEVVPQIIRVITLGTYIGSMLFFFRARKANRAINVGPAALGDTPPDA